jgi:hypothetical protein
MSMGAFGHTALIAATAVSLSCSPPSQLAPKRTSNEGGAASVNAILTTGGGRRKIQEVEAVLAMDVEAALASMQPESQRRLLCQKRQLRGY